MTVIPFIKPVIEKLKRNRSRNKGYQIRTRNGKHSVVIRLKEGTDTRTFDNLTLAHDWARQRVQSIKYGTEPSIRNKKLKDWTLRQLVDHYIAYATDHEFIGSDIRHKSFFTLEVPLLKRIMVTHAWLFDKQLSYITVDDWQRQMEDRLNGRNGVSKATADTWHKEISVVAYIIGYYARDVHPDRLPIPEWFKGFKKPKKNTKRTNRVLKPGEFELIQAEILKSSRHWVNLQYSTMLHWLYETCIRPGALTLITWKDIDWNSNGYWQQPEKRSPLRYIPLRLAMMERIKDYYKQIPEDQRKPDKPVFWLWGHKNKGTAYAESQLSDQFRIFFNKAGITDTHSDPKNGFCLHMLRHTAMNRYEGMGMIPTDVEYLAGHKTGSTKRVATYWHGSVNRIRDIIDPGWKDRPAIAQFTVPEQFKPSLNQESFWRNAYSKGGEITKQHSEPGFSALKSSLGKIYAEISFDKLLEIVRLEYPECTEDQLKDILKEAE